MNAIPIAIDIMAIVIILLVAYIAAREIMDWLERWVNRGNDDPPLP